MDNSTQPDSNEQLVRYLDDELDREEKDLMEKQLSSDGFLRDQLEELKLAKEAVRQYGLRRQVAGIHGEMMKELKTPVRSISPAKRAFRYSMAVAAGILLLAGAFFIYNFFTLSSDKVFASMHQEFEVITMRGSSADEAIMKAYREKKYNEVIRIQEEGEDSSVPSIFLAAMSKLELNRVLDAIKDLEGIVIKNRNSTQPVLKDEAEYYLALSYIKNRDYDLALPIMEAIYNDPAHLYNEKVSRKDIRKVKMLKWR